MNLERLCRQKTSTKKVSLNLESRMLLSAQIQPKSFDCRTKVSSPAVKPGDWCLRACPSALLFWQSIVIQTLRQFYGGTCWRHEASSGDSGRQMRGDKEHFLNSIANYDRVWRNRRRLEARLGVKLQALVYDILPSTTAVFSYAMGSRKLSANEQIFVGAQIVVRLLQTTQIKHGVSFIAANKVYTSTNKTTIVWIETELFLGFLPGVDASHVYVRALALGCFYIHISTRTVRRALIASLDRCAEIKSAPSVA